MVKVIVLLGQAVYADTPNFADVDRVALLVVQESTIVPG